MNDNYVKIIQNVLKFILYSSIIISQPKYSCTNSFKGNVFSLLIIKNSLTKVSVKKYFDSILALKEYRISRDMVTELSLSYSTAQAIFFWASHFF